MNCRDDAASGHWMRNRSDHRSYLLDERHSKWTEKRSSRFTLNGTEARQRTRKKRRHRLNLTCDVSQFLLAVVTRGCIDCTRRLVVQLARFVELSNDRWTSPIVDADGLLVNERIEETRAQQKENEQADNGSSKAHSSPVWAGDQRDHGSSRE